jgi:hypothetical protein
MLGARRSQTVENGYDVGVRPQGCHGDQSDSRAVGLDRIYVTAANSGRRGPLDVRRSENAEPHQLVVDVADLPEPPEGVDDDVEIVLESDRCPSPAS